MSIQIILLMLAGCFVLFAELPYKLPAKAKYTVSDEDVARAKATLKAHLGTNAATLTNLFAPPMVCGPGLWHSLKGSPYFSKPPHAKSTARIPMADGKDLELPFALLQTPHEVASFGNALAELLHSQGKLTVREPNQVEFNKYWAVIPYDNIEAPLLVAEGKDVTILCQFAKGRVFWADEVKQMEFKKTGAD